MCIFCKIVSGEIPSKKVYEDENVIAILDISQATKGHTLVIPKKHSANLLEIDSEEYINVMKAVNLVTKKLSNTLKPAGINILNNCGEVAGQTVMHFHVHVIPRYEENDIQIGFTNNSSNYNLDEIMKLINN